jgi:signal transduction histidine kinase
MRFKLYPLVGLKSLEVFILLVFSYPLFCQKSVNPLLDSIYKAEVLSSDSEEIYFTLVRNAGRNWIARDTSIALYINQRGIDSCMLASDLSCILKLKNERGIIYSIVKDYESSRKEFKKALEFGDIFMDSSIIGYVHRNMGVAFRSNAKMDSAINHLYYALDYLDFGKSGDSLLIALTLEELAKCLYYSNLNNFSTKYADEALKIAEELNRKSLIASLLNLKGLNALNGNLSLAKEILDKSLKISLDLKDTVNIIVNYHNNAVYYIQSKVDWEKALDIINMALSLDKNSKRNNLRGPLLITKARALYGMGKIDEAEYTLLHELKPEDISDQSVSPLEYHYYLLSNIKRIKGEYDESIDFLEKYYEWRIQNNNIQNEMLFSIRERDMEFSKKRKENLLLKESNALLAQSLEDQKRYLKILWTFATALVLAGIYLIQFNIKLSKSKLKIKSINEDLKEKNHQLVDLIDTKDSLLSIIGHDLRSPALNILQLIQTVLERKETLTEDSQENLAMSANSVGLMIQILDNLLAWAKTDKNTVIIDNKHFQLQEVVTPVVKLYQSMFKFKRLQFENRMECLENCYSDKGIIEIVIRNLLNNAIKYSPPNSTIRMGSSRKGDICEFYLEDGAGGLPEKVENQIFNAENDSDTPRHIALTEGFGLKLCRDLLRLSGIQWSYKRTEKGSRFILLFPVEKEIAFGRTSV